MAPARVGRLAERAVPAGRTTSKFLWPQLVRVDGMTATKKKVGNGLFSKLSNEPSFLAIETIIEAL